MRIEFARPGGAETISKRGTTPDGNGLRVFRAVMLANFLQ
jgi:hypothetical protein